MATEQPHAAFAQSIDQIDIVVIDDSKSMQSILRSMLNSFKVLRVRTYDGAQMAMDAMLVDPPHLIIVDWLMEPIDGLTCLKALRTQRMGRLAVVPAIILTSAPTLRLVEESLRVGAHAVLAKPISPATLQKRIKAILADPRPFVLADDADSWQLDGAFERLAAQHSRQRQYRHARDQYIEVAKRKIASKPVAPEVSSITTALESAAAQLPGLATPKATEETAKPRRLRKAVGIGARRVDPLAPVPQS